MAKKSRRTNSSHKDEDSTRLVSSNGEPPAAEQGGDQAEARVALHEVAQSRYINYALSVITSRALPDVRDGLKPVQRRILYTMWIDGVRAEGRHRKSANVVGQVMGRYHPHGDQAIYDALVRLAQPFVMRLGLIDGSGNFGSLDGDPPAAMRYTECRLRPVAAELLQEIGQQTVPFRPNYDGTREEPVVLPARLPNLLINGSAGIAVGMATSIPPHNPEEVCQALLRLMDNPDLTSAQLARTIKGPDFPTGGRLVSSRDQIRDMYKTGQGTLKLRATWEEGPTHRASRYAHITSIPFGVNKSQLVERIGELIANRKMPLLLDVKDLSTEDVRLELEMKKDADPRKVLAYLFRHTPLQINHPVNLTCLLPTEKVEVGRPERCDLREILSSFLSFRLEVVTRRLQHELSQLEKRLHILEGLAFAFDVLDEILALIRQSDGKADAAEKIAGEYGIEAYGEGGLDEPRIDAILELKLYRLARLEIHVIQEELERKEKRAGQIRDLLHEEEATGLWRIVREEIEQIRKTHGKADKRRTLLETVEQEEEPQLQAEDLILAEDNHVLVSTDGWVRRQKQIRNPANPRLRQGDAVLTCQVGSTRASIVFFSNLGIAYTARIADLPATTGYGEPIQKRFKLADGEHLVAACSLDPRAIGDIHENPHSDRCPPVHALAVTSDGYGLRFGLEGFVEPSTKAGRKFARPTHGARVVGVQPVHGTETVVVATRHARALLCHGEEVNYLSSAGKGVQLIKLEENDRVLGFTAAADDRDTLRAKTSHGGEQRINTAKYKVVSRGGKGHEVIKRGKLTEVMADEPTAPSLLDE